MAFTKHYHATQALLFDRPDEALRECVQVRHIGVIYSVTEAARYQQLQALLKELKDSGRSAPKSRVPIGIENIRQLK